jgi:hypothetical protein
MNAKSLNSINNGDTHFMKRITKNTSKANFLALYLMGILFGLVSVYILIQYTLFDQRYKETFVNKTRVLEENFRNTLKNYEDVLKEFSQGIQKRDLFSDPGKLSALFEKSYAYGVENKNGQNLHISALNWIDKSGKVAVGRFGTLLNKLKFDPEYTQKLKRNPGNLKLSNAIPDGDHADASIINLGIGTIDKDEIYRGFVNIRVEANVLLERIMTVKDGDNVQVIMLDKNTQVLASSIPLSEENQRKINTTLKLSQRTNLSKENYVFTEKVSINGYPFSLIFGYSITSFILEFFKYILPQIIGIISFSLVVIIFSYAFHMRELKKGWRGFRNKIKELNTALFKANEQNCQHDLKRKVLEEDSKCAEEAAKAKEHFLWEVNKRVSEATSALLNTGNALLERVKYQEDMNDDPQEVMGIFEKAYFHACFVCTKSTEDNIDIKRLFDESIKIHAHKIRENQITISKVIDKTLKTLLTDAFSLKQLIINILGRAIRNTPTEGKIEITVLGRKDNVSIEIKDNGYSGSFVEGEKKSLDGMTVEWDNLKRLAQSLGGTLSFHHMPYKGNHFKLDLPYEFSKTSLTKEKFILPVADNIIHFSSWNKINDPKS